MKETIENPNSCGQGFCPQHTENRYHELLAELGWKYSHTTAIRYMWPRDNERYAIHTYRFPATDWVVGIEMRDGNAVTCHKLGRGYKYVNYSTHFCQYIKRKTAQIKRELKANNNAH